MSWFTSLPPLHPILVNFTAALVPASLLSDVLARVLKRESLRSAAWWMLLYAAVITPLTATAGWFWLDDMGGMDHREMDVHKWLGTALTVVFLLLAAWRGRFHARGVAPGALYLITVGLVVAALTLQGHLGGMMSFGTGEASAEDVPKRAGTPMTQPAKPSDDGHRHEHGEIEWRESIDVGA